MTEDNTKASAIDAIAVAGILPLLPYVRDFSSGFFLSIMLVVLSLFLQILAALLGKALRPWAWKMGIVFLSSVALAIMFKAVELLDARSALALSEALAFVVFTGIMRYQYRSWMEDMERGIRFDLARLLPVLGSALILLLLGSVRELFGLGSFSLPAFGAERAPVSVRPFAGMPSTVVGMPAGALLLAGYCIAALRLFARKREKGASKR